MYNFACQCGDFFNNENSLIEHLNTHLNLVLNLDILEINFIEKKMKEKFPNDKILLLPSNYGQNNFLLKVVNDNFFISREVPYNLNGDLNSYIKEFDSLYVLISNIICKFQEIDTIDNIIFSERNFSSQSNLLSFDVFKAGKTSFFEIDLNAIPFTSLSSSELIIEANKIFDSLKSFYSEEMIGSVENFSSDFINEFVLTEEDGKQFKLNPFFEINNRVKIEILEVD